MHSLGLVSRCRIGPLLFAIQEISVSGARRNIVHNRVKVSAPGGPHGNFTVARLADRNFYAARKRSPNKKAARLFVEHFRAELLGGACGHGLRVSRMFRWRSKLSIHREMRVTLKKGETWRSKRHSPEKRAPRSRPVHTVSRIAA